MAYSLHVHLPSGLLAADAAMELAEQLSVNAKHHRVGDVIIYDGKQYRIRKIERVGTNAMDRNGQRAPTDFSACW